MVYKLNEILQNIIILNGGLIFIICHATKYRHLIFNLQFLWTTNLITYGSNFQITFGGFFM